MGAMLQGLAARDGDVVPDDPDALARRVNACRDGRLEAGFDDPVTGKTYQCDETSIGKWTAIGASAGLAMVAGTDPAPEFSIITADNSVITLSAAEAFELLNTRLMPWVSSTVLYARAVKDAIAAGNAPEDITAGWPEV